MGSGDWNDGMNQVGEHGKGESVWLGFFLYDVLTRFAEVARIRDDGSLRGALQERGGAAYASILKKTAGMANGIAARTSMMALR